jgi:FADH2 O2-dependent halogenase
MSRREFDMAVVGSGFGGSLIALIARRLGRSVVMLEKGQHPRFAIGESSTPLANYLLEALSDEYDLPRVRPLSKWGTWQRNYPQLSCGLKRGFSFFHHSFGRRHTAGPGRVNQLLVAASPRDEIADTHWYRPDFDHFLVQEAQAAGVEYVDRLNLDAPEFRSDSVALSGERLGQKVDIGARFLIDATGPRGYLHQSLKLPEEPFEHLPRTEALFSHFSGVHRLENLGLAGVKDGTPFPVDDAAVHHLFDGGWIWVLRFNNGLTSAGVAARETAGGLIGSGAGQSAWDRLLARLPSVQEQFAQAKAEIPFKHLAPLAFRDGRVTGPNWALLPSAAGFIDPLLSTGFALTLLGVMRLARLIRTKWTAGSWKVDLMEYERRTKEELLAAERLIAALYASMHDCSWFTPLAMLYFAPISFSEIACRLGRSDLVSSFLLHDWPEFGPRARACCELAMRLLSGTQNSAESRDLLQKQVLETIAPLDVIGLSDLSRRNWYPAKPDDLAEAERRIAGMAPRPLPGGRPSDAVDKITRHE